MNWEEITFGAITVAGMVEWLKTFDKESKWKKYYKFLPLLSSTIPAFLIALYINDFRFSVVALNYLGIFSASILGYETVIDTIQKKLKN